MTRYRAWQDAEQLVTRVNAWLRELPRGTRLEVAPTPLITMNGAPAVAVGEIRAKIAQAGQRVSPDHGGPADAR